MADFTFGPPRNFLGLGPEHSDPEQSGVLLLPVPYEGTTCYRGGTRHGPDALIEASISLELYDREFGCEAALRWGIHTLPALAPERSSPEAMVEAIERAVARFAADGRLLGVLGGEHTISIGVARGLRRVYPDFVTVQIDAHADLRDGYEGSPYSHACTARRILEGGGQVVQLGIRSLDVTEADFMAGSPDKVVTLFAEELLEDPTALQRIVPLVAGRNVYLTVDLDGLDPSIMPATGTPEPGGLLWRDVLNIVRTVAANGQVIGFDCVELAPIPGLVAPDVTAAKLVYKIINHVMSRR